MTSLLHKNQWAVNIKVFALFRGGPQFSDFCEHKLYAIDHTVSVFVLLYIHP